MHSARKRRAGDRHPEPRDNYTRTKQSLKDALAVLAGDAGFAGILRFIRTTDTAALDGVLTSAFGWQVQFRQHPRGLIRSELSAMNFPIQANGAEMMRLATITAVERGVQVCAIVHDAFVIEAADDQIDEAVALMHAAMDRACATVLGKQRVLPVQTKVFSRGVDLLDADALAIFQAVFPERGLDKGVTP